MDRAAAIQRLRKERFDLLIVGGGATGTGVALDAASRGLKTALVERDDFASGTSSRSTKLIHGGVRYLEQAVKQMARDQYKLVRDALHERAILLNLAPHLARPLGLVTPLYKWLDAPYYMAGLRLYDWIAGKANLKNSYYVDAKEALERFPMLKKEGLRGGVVYFDGQFDDARMNVSLALTASELGAAVANHVAVVRLVKVDGRLAGVELEDAETKERWVTSARLIVNATGPFCDSLRRMDNPETPPLLTASSGIHVVLDKSFSPPDMGLLIPRTEDNRVLFLLPWLGHTLVGTTDNPAEIVDNPEVKPEDIDYILRQLKQYFSLTVTNSDILASWCGLRPLVSDLKSHDTAHLSRDHIVNVSRSGLLTVTGGKWTTYRKMALDAVDHAVREGGLSPAGPSRTHDLPIAGGEGYHPRLAVDLQRDFDLPEDIAIHLASSYGTRAVRVAEISRRLGARLAPPLPYLEAEVVYGAEVESARTSVDILARRTRISFLNHEATRRALPRVVELLKDVLGWDTARAKADYLAAQKYLRL